MQEEWSPRLMFGSGLLNSLVRCARGRDAR
jgi:hypothetical protein